MAEADATIDLLGAAEVLHEHLTVALCDEVFEDVREGERRRQITLAHLAQFWTAVVLRAPPSLTHALASKGDFPSVPGTRQAFFARSQDLSWEFFHELFEAFCARVEAVEPARFARRFIPLINRFEGRVLIADGSTLDQVARRLKLLWKDRRVPLPGSVVAFYDLSRGTLARLCFEATPQGKEMPTACDALEGLPKGALVVGDRLYGVPKFFGELARHGLYGLARRNGVAKLERVETLSKEGGVEDCLVDLGTGRGTATQRLRLIRRTAGGRRIELLTNVLDPRLFSAAEALELYAERWSVERLFYDLKEVLDLHCFYAANTNAVAMQVYAAGIVHVALRTAQGRIAAQAQIEPERISTKKLFPKVAAASVALTHAEIAFDQTQQANPTHRLKKPDWHVLPNTRTPLSSVLVEPRNGKRKRHGRNSDRARRRQLPPAPPRPEP
jgi:hypothetical protein